MKQKIKYWWQRRTRGWSDDETWCLDYTFILWLDSRLNKYVELAGKVIDLGFHKIGYKGKVYSVEILINKLLTVTEYLKEHYNEEDDVEKMHEMLDLFTVLFPYLNW